VPYVHGHLRDGQWVRPRYRVSRRAIAGWVAAAAAVPVILAAGAALRHVGPAAEPGPAVSSASSGKPAAIGGGLSLYVEPEASMEPVYRLISQAHRMIRLAMYELNDATAEQALAAAARRHVHIEVLLDRNRERTRNQAAYSYLAAHGVQVRWADPRYTATHEKVLTVDGNAAAIMTGNMVAGDYPGTRDFLVVDRQLADVAAIDDTVLADLAERTVTPAAGTDLVWSPTTSQSRLLSLIAAARHTLAVENEEMDDPDVTAALLAALRRHVEVTLVLTTNPEWESTLMQLQAAGARIVELSDSSGSLYIHAKAIAADAGTSTARVFVGSQNFSIASLRYNRELGLATSAAPLVSAVAAVIRSDAAD
jgi:phosphatidylserine/phosphatidylglycerophosphate/cardiolipin synthase-like enzyme